MPIVLISSPPHGFGQELAEELERKTGWPLFTRRQMAELAGEQGIKLSRLETSIVKAPVIPEKLAREKDLYLTFVTARLYEMARAGNLIYYDRAAHLLFPGISHRVRVGLGVLRRDRIDKVVRDLRLSPEKAAEYLDKLDEDIEKWIHFLHRQSARDPEDFDIFFNLHNMSLANASALLCDTATLPDFRPTPASIKRLDDLYLAARAKLRLAADEHTRSLDLGVRAVGGVVTVTYMPRQEAAASSISQVLQGLEDCRENVCTMAETSLLWIQEAFDPQAESFKQVTRLAQRWGAAVELLRLVPHAAEVPVTSADTVRKDAGPPKPAEQAFTGGVEDDETEAPVEDGGLAATQEELVAIGRSAGGFTAYGGTHEIIEALENASHYSLVILGDLFLDKGAEARKRQTRELGLTIRDRLKAAVITVDELESRFMFGKKQAIKALGYAAALLCLYALVFNFQGPILNFLGGELHANWKWVGALAVVLFVPLVAYAYGTVTGLLLKLIDID